MEWEAKEDSNGLTSGPEVTVGDQVEHDDTSVGDDESNSAEDSQICPESSGDKRRHLATSKRIKVK